MKAEQQLRASLKEMGDLKAALDEHAILAITDPQGKITYANDKFCAISKYPRSELLGQDHRLINSGYHPKEFFRDLWATITQGRTWHGEIRNRAKDGSFYWVDSTIVPFLNESGKPRQYVSIRVDITERKRAEEALRQSRVQLEAFNAELEKRVAERTAQLETANKELAAFSYSISHDLRAPLRAMSGFTAILEKQTASQLSPEARESLQRIRENAARMAQLIDRLLDFCSLGWVPLTKHSAAPADIARAVVEELRPEFANRRVDIEIGRMPSCQADTALLKQVYANLLSNAVKYTRGRDPAAIKVGCRKDTDSPVYFVQDNGAGFDMNYAHKLFQVFQRLHSADQFEGTGVGLAIVQRIVQRHGGRVWAESQLDKGATFYFTL